MLRLHYSLLIVSWMMATSLLTGCVGQSSPPTRFYLLSAITTQETATAPHNASNPKKGLIVELEPVEIPQYLNRPEIVTRSGNNGLQLERLNQWAGDLKEDIGRVLMENLSWILASDRVVILPNRSDGIPHFRIMTSINRFEANASGLVSLDARWTLFDGKGGQLSTHHSRLNTQATRHDDYESLAAAMSKALDEWSREIGAIILARSGQQTP